MWFCDARLSRGPLGLALLSALLCLCGCGTTSKTSLFAVSGPGWQVREGQALWQPRQGFPQLGGEMVVASHQDGRCFIQFAKTPLPLVSVQTTGTNWLISFPSQRMAFTGNKKPPTRFAWLYLHAALSGAALPAELQFERKADGGWRLANLRSGESVEGFVAP
jgi:hypothetical protein